MIKIWRMNYQRKRDWATRCYRPFSIWRGVIRHAHTTGKPHYYVRLISGYEACVTAKESKGTVSYLLHYPAYSSNKAERYIDIAALNERLRGLGALVRPKKP